MPKEKAQQIVEFTRYFYICRERNCKKLFFNDDDNVCHYCGSKKTTRLKQQLVTLLTEEK